MRSDAATALAALALANARYWSTVAPHVQRELRHWQGPASAIGDPRLRALALEKLRRESFNAEVAATIATLAPREHRTDVSRAIVALELLFDYLDGRTEQPPPSRVEQALHLYQPFVDALAVEDGGSPRAPLHEGTESGDRQYLRSLSTRTSRLFGALPAAGTVSETASASARRCAEGQAHLHAGAAPGVGVAASGPLERWAREQAADSGLEWREYLAGCASSVLAAHAMIAAAAEQHTSEPDARKLDAAYLAIAAVVTILDSLVDAAEDRTHGQAGFIALYEPGELPGRMRRLTREALARAREAPHGAHHAMTLAGVAAYYTTHPGARAPGAEAVVHAVRGELAPTIWPAVAVLHGWRLAKRARRAMRDTTGAPAINSSHGDTP